MVRTVARGSTVVRIERLGGGLGAATHSVTLRRPSGRTHDVVLKRFSESGEGLDAEWGRTVFASTLPVPSPEPIAYDESGSWFGTPAYVLSRLPGRAHLRFADDDRTYEQIAEALVAIASTPKRQLPAVTKQPAVGSKWQPPPGIRRTPLVERTIRTIRRLRPAAMKQEHVLAHNDFHPGNMLWTDGRLTGLVDWGFCNLAYRSRDVGYCFVELSVLNGARAADRFLDAYERVAGKRADHIRLWKLSQGLSALKWVRYWALAYREQGRRDLTDEIATRRARAAVHRALG